MARINLLPWREELRRERKKRFLASLGVAVGVTVLVMSGFHLREVDRISFQQERNSFLQQAIKRLDKDIAQIRTLETQKKKLLAHMEIIQKLQASRPEVVHLFVEMVKTLPDGVYLTKLQQTGTAITLYGVAQSNARVSTFMWNLERSPWLDKPNLLVIETKGKGADRYSHFQLKVEQVHKRVNGEGQG